MTHEINLLPPARRRRLRRLWLQETVVQVLRHVQIALGVMTLLGALAGGGLQIMLILSPEDGSESIPPLIREYQMIRQNITSQNVLAEAVEARSKNRIVWSDLLSGLLEILPPNTTIEQIQATSIPSQLLFSGTSVNRSANVILKSRLEGLSWASQIEAPLQNLLDRENPEYSFTVHIKPVQAEPTPTPILTPSPSP